MAGVKFSRLVPKMKKCLKDLLANGVLDQERVGGDAADNLARAGIGVEESHVLLQQSFQVFHPDARRLPLPSLHPRGNLCTTKPCHHPLT